MADPAMPHHTPAPQPTRPGDAHDLRALLEAVLAVLAVPYTAADYDAQIHSRTYLIRATLEGALAEDPDGIGWNADYLRSKVAAEQAADKDKPAEAQR